MKAIVDRARLSFAVQRWELLLVVGGTAVLTALFLYVAWQAHVVVQIDPSCFTADGGGPACQRLQEQFNGFANLGTQLLYASFGAPFGMGLVLGVPLIAREIEHGTAGMAWTLSPWRLRWLLPRIAFVALVAVGLLGVIAVVSDVVAQTIRPNLHLAADFSWYGRRGGLIVLRGVLALAIGVAIGAIFGRQLPALLVAIFASIAIFTAISFGMDRWVEADAVPMPFGVDAEGGKQLGDRVRLPDGRLVSWAELDPSGQINIAIDSDGSIYTSFDDNGMPTGDPIARAISLVVPGALYPTVVLRESALLGGLALIFAGLSCVVVQRRRPY